MKWILIFFFIATYGSGKGSSAISVEFDDGLACNAAANVLSRAFHEEKGVTISTCVPKGTEP